MLKDVARFEARININPKMTMRIILFLFLAGSLVSMPAAVKSKTDSKTTKAKAAAPAAATKTNPAATTSNAGVSVDQVLNNYIQAIGGRNQLLAVKTRIMKGSLSAPILGNDIPWELRAKAPSKRLTTMNIPSMGPTQEGFNGVSGWTCSSFAGLSEKTGDELENTKREVDFYREINLKQLYSKWALAGRQKLENNETYVLEAVPTKGATEKLYFDTQSFLLIRRDVEIQSSEGKVQAAMYFEDYRVVDGIKLPFIMRMTSPEMAKFTLKIAQISHNLNLDDSQFEKPQVAKTAK